MRLLVSILSLALLTTWVASPLSAQKLNKKPKEVLVLKVTDEGGTNASSVMYDPKAKTFVTAFAGNTSYHIETFSTKGKNLGGSEGLVDIRGMWYDADEKTLMAVDYYEGVVFTIMRNAKGLVNDAMPGDLYIERPYDQCVVALDKARGELLSHHAGVLYWSNYTTDGYYSDSLFLMLPDDVVLEDLNENSVIYVDYTAAPYGVLNHAKKEVMLFNASGLMKERIKLPYDAPVMEGFNFSYAKGHIFLFDQEERAWKGYKIL